MSSAGTFKISATSANILSIRRRRNMSSITPRPDFPGGRRMPNFAHGAKKLSGNLMNLRRRNFRLASRSDDESYTHVIRRGGATPRPAEKCVALRVGRKWPICGVVATQQPVLSGLLRRSALHLGHFRPIAGSLGFRTASKPTPAGICRSSMSSTRPTSFTLYTPVH